MNTQQQIEQISADSIAVKQQILETPRLTETIAIVADLCTTALKNGKKILFCGNGGSAADAQHLAAEFSGRFYTDRDALPAEALHCNTSYLTAVANDYSYDEVYSRLLQAKGRVGDVLFALSTSGNSSNILRALDTANQLEMDTIGMTGATGGKMAVRCRYLLKVPSGDTPRIQESHILMGHIICQLVEERLFPRG